MQKFVEMVEKVGKANFWEHLCRKVGKPNFLKLLEATRFVFLSFPQTFYT